MLKVRKRYAQYVKLNHRPPNRWEKMVDTRSPAYASLVQCGENICRAVGIKYGISHLDLKSRYDSKKGRYSNPVMIEIAAFLAGGLKSIMALETVPGWYPFDEMTDAHCGFSLRMPQSFLPVKVARHVFIPSPKNGIMARYIGSDFNWLPSHNAHIMLCKKRKILRGRKNSRS